MHYWTSNVREIHDSSSSKYLLSSRCQFNFVLDFSIILCSIFRGDLPLLLMWICLILYFDDSKSLMKHQPVLHFKSYLQLIRLILILCNVHLYEQDSHRRNVQHVVEQSIHYFYIFAFTNFWNRIEIHLKE